MILINAIDLFEQYLSAYTKHFKCGTHISPSKQSPGRPLINILLILFNIYVWAAYVSRKINWTD